MLRKLYAAWLAFAEILGAINIRVLLGALFFLLVTPVACWRRIRGIDNLRLRQFKKSRGSVMENRDHAYTREDLLHTF
jgi:multisubunit Na+/H+ antiporter MnhG subunit